MSFQYFVLGSGSEGNSYLFSDGQTTLLIDAGFSCKELVRRIQEAKFSPEQINYLFITHGHQDHTKGAPTFSNKFHIPLYTNPKTLIKGALCKYRHDFQPGDVSPSSSFNIQAFYTSHDSYGSMSYFLEMGGKNILILTDTGKTDDMMLDFARKSDIIFLEANYCPKMLAEGPYPDKLKRRILSEYGHLSNMDSINFLNKVVDAPQCRLEKVFFCHLSDKNNSPERLQEYLKKYYRGSISYVICPRSFFVKGEENEENLLSDN